MKKILTATLALGALALPAVAQAGTGTDTIRPRSAVADKAHVEFRLPNLYKQIVGALEGTPAIGSFRRDAGGGCDVTLTVVSNLTANPPTKRGSLLRVGKRRPAPFHTDPDLRLRRTARAAGGRLYLGTPVGGTIDRAATRVEAVAILRAPKRIATKRSKWLVVRVSPAATNCTAAEQQAATGRVSSEVWQIVRTVKVVAGKAGPARGVSRVPA
ncbi:MAG TPA: hypothetical protein VN238_23325 [Solirubrobacteraceae bacterium]|nr:hypothetical protein [Solirubrobacteraceae bacterium]